ncbi:MAG: MFS transporter [Nitrososphaerota archaeon]|nr:MFS transporter [Candidatus Bathyarchaeota archaeon]MDW8022563.1 MFS transporter [Nitrososphaerota archaeon]
MKENNYRWTILGLVYMCQFSFALVFQSVPPILRLIVDEFKITQAQAGLLMSLFALPGILLSIPGGMICDRFGAKNLGFASLSLMILGTSVMGLSNSFALIAFARAVSGIGGALMAVILPQLISRWFMHRELGTAMGVFNTAMPLGTITSFNVLSIVGATWGWRTSIFLTTVMSIGAFLIFLSLFRDPEPQPRRLQTSALSTLLKIGKPIWLVGLTWLLFNASSISFLTFAPAIFMIKGYEITSASSLTSIVMMGPLFLSPFIGYFAKKFEREELFILVGGLSLAVLTFSFSIINLPILIIVLIALFTALVPSPVFSLPSKVVKPENLGLAFGITTTCSNMGILIGPYLAGLAKDLTGEYIHSLYLMSTFNMLQAMAILMLHFMRSKAHPVSLTAKA